MRRVTPAVECIDCGIRPFDPRPPLPQGWTTVDGNHFCPQCSLRNTVKGRKR